MDSNRPPSDRLVSGLRLLIRQAVRVLAVLMTLVIFSGVADVGWTLYQKLSAPPRYILTIGDMLATFGAFIAVLIAIEIFINITIYLRDDVIHVKIVMATALMAIARKIIILDPELVDAPYLWGLASVALAMSVGYWLVVVNPTLWTARGRTGSKDEDEAMAGTDLGGAPTDSDTPAEPNLPSSDR
jgi:uncharacterized membrane protein (DUF373 family)